MSRKEEVVRHCHHARSHVDLQIQFPSLPLIVLQTSPAIMTNSNTKAYLWPTVAAAALLLAAYFVFSESSQVNEPTIIYAPAPPSAPAHRSASSLYVEERLLPPRTVPAAKNPPPQAPAPAPAPAQAPAQAPGLAPARAPTSRVHGDGTGAYVIPENWSGYSLDDGLVKVLTELFAGKSVNDFGGGVGRYKVALEDTGRVGPVTTYDGAKNIEQVSHGIAKYANLAEQLNLPVADWVLCLEVGEHIPKQFEDTFIDNLVRHNREGIVLSWGVPGQPGIDHVNTRSNSYIKAKMAERGLVFDADASMRVTAASTMPWFKKSTIMVFIK